MSKENGKKNLIKLLWEKEFIRFLFSGAVNTIAGYAVMTLFGNLIIKAPLELGDFTISIDMLAILFEFICCFPLSYTLQAKVTFRQKWEIKRMFMYITTIIPNLLLQWLLAALIPAGMIHPLIRNGIIVVFPLPIMFIVIKFIVTPVKNIRKGKSE